jgi:hypothetical protein
MPHPLDEYPIHQVPLSMEYVGTSDKDFYDRNIFHVIPHGQHDMQLIAGFGVYPNLGVRDAYCCVRVGTKQYTVRASDAMDNDRMRMEVGPIRIEVIEPLKRVRVVCEGGGTADEGEVSCDMEWTPYVPIHDEAHHIMRTGTKTILDASRFLGIGQWTGVVRAGGQEFQLDHENFTGTRDRSWGIRPVGESTPPGRWAAELEPKLHWFWIPLRFKDFCTVVLIQEESDGYRTHSEAVRMWTEESGVFTEHHGTEQLGWPQVDVRYRSGTRHPESATIHMITRDRTPVTIEVETLGCMPLNVGCGYGADPDWSHGQWRGRDWVNRQAYDLTDPAVAGRVPFSVIDHLARARCGDEVGYGIFEHGTIGRHDPSGFTGLFDVAP